MRAPMLIGFAAAVVLGLAAGTGGALMLAHPRATSAADSADTARARKAKRAAGDSARRAAAAGDAARPEPTPSALHLPTLAAPPTASRQAAIDSAVRVQAAAQMAAREHLAKVFATMEPKGAAAVLEQMSDGEVTQILGAIQERQAAAILEYFTPQRAAAVSRALLHSPRSTS
jgi:flagellar motility protein MotE (MotC chaperone)